MEIASSILGLKPCGYKIRPCLVILFEGSFQGFESSKMWVPLLSDAFGKRNLNRDYRVFRIQLSIKRVSI